MSTTLSDYAENKVIDHLCGTSAWVMPAAVSIALFTTNPNFETGAGGVEATGGGYVRKAALFTAASGGAATGPTIIAMWTVGTDISAGTYTGWAVYDALTGGNILFGESFLTDRVLTGAGEIIIAAANSMTVNIG